jgi:PAS domain S-box-containing protein
MNILIVDDHPLNLKLLRAQLEAVGHCVLEAANGVEALAVLEREPVAAIISDILMPQMDGYQLCHEVRAHPRFYHLPFIVYTSTYTSPGDEKLALDVGADRYLNKPADSAVILETLRDVVAAPNSRQLKPASLPKELTLMKEYNERLVHKLEEKNLQLETAQETLLLHATALDKAANAILITDHTGRILSVNPAFVTLTGYPAAEALGQTPRLLKSGRHDAAFYRDFWQTIIAGRTWRGEFVNRRKDGTLFYSEHTVAPIREAGGRITHFIGILQDVTARRQAEEALRQSEQQLRNVIDGLGANTFVGLLTPEGVLVEVNRSALAAAGLQPADVLGKPFDQTYWWAHAESVQAKLRAAMGRAAAGEISRYDAQVRGVGGALFWVDFSLCPLRDASGRVTHLIPSANVIEERKRTEAELRRTADLLDAVAAGTPDAVFVKDLAGRYLLFNEAAARFVGRPAAEVIGQDDTALFDPAGAAMVMAYDRAVRETGRSQTNEENLLAAGVRRTYLATKAPYRDAQGSIVGTIGISHDITERKQMEEELRAANARYARQEAALLALTRSGALLKGHAPEVLREIAEVTARTLGVGRVSVWRYERDRKDIACLALYQRGENLHSAGGRLREEDYPAYFHALAEADVIAADDAHGDARTAEFSQMYLGPLGIGAMLDAPVHLQGAMAGVLCCEHIGPARRWTTDEQTFAVAAANLVSLLLAQTEGKKLEAQLRQAQKMEAIGTLAGGIAHDFNNILSAINGFTELAKMESVSHPVALGYLDEVAKAGTRAADLVRQILTFSRQRDQERKPLQLRHVVAEAFKLLRATIPATIQFKVSLSSATPTVLADATQIHQIVMNLATNAAHAMRDQPGWLEARLEGLEVDAALVAAHPELRPGRYARLTIGDTGHGMDRATLERIFEPFFTTKALGEGTGLGLAVVHGIVMAHDGCITVQSQPGQGTTFSLFFPALATEEAEAAAGPAAIPRGHGERILLLDDEEPLVMLGKKMLERLGYTVATETNPLLALSAFQAQPDAYDLVVTDLAMPRMAGTELARQLLLIRPTLPIILVTGYSASLTGESVQAMGIRELVLKPLSRHSLGEAVDRVLKANPKPRTEPL